MDSETDGLILQSQKPFGDAGFQFVEGSKDLNPNVWINVAVSQVLNAQNDVAYVRAVGNFESVMVSDTDKKDSVYAASVAKCAKDLKDSKDAGEVEVLLARFKFRELMKLIERKRPKDVVLQC
jgi:hypothetical protein